MNYHWQNKKSGHANYGSYGASPFIAATASELGILELGSPTKHVQLIYMNNVTGVDYMVEVVAATTITTTVKTFTDADLSILTRTDLARTSTAVLGRNATEDPSSGDLNDHLRINSATSDKAHLHFLNNMLFVAAPGEFIRIFPDTINTVLQLHVAWVEFI